MARREYKAVVITNHISLMNDTQGEDINLRFDFVADGPSGERLDDLDVIFNTWANAGWELKTLVSSHYDRTIGGPGDPGIGSQGVPAKDVRFQYLVAIFERDG